MRWIYILVLLSFSQGLGSKWRWNPALSPRRWLQRPQKCFFVATFRCGILEDFAVVCVCVPCCWLVLLLKLPTVKYFPLVFWKHCQIFFVCQKILGIPGTEAAGLRSTHVLHLGWCCWNCNCFPCTCGCCTAPWSKWWVSYHWMRFVKLYNIQREAVKYCILFNVE